MFKIPGGEIIVIDWNLPPDEIERRSFEIIDAESPRHQWDNRSWQVVRRMVHTSADFEYVASVIMHPKAIDAGIAALHRGKRIVTDTTMALSGLSPGKLKAFGVTKACLIGDEATARMARENKTTRAAAAIDLALEQGGVGIFVIGNAPTALFRLLEKIEQGANPPDLIVGLPVGFVNAAESKDALAQSRIPHITNKGRKGGSNVAASVVNALAVLAQEDV
jgi:precorrin-8X/cobalt-precorrin-8 methylmutase